jgi:hypothetical protein
LFGLIKSEQERRKKVNEERSGESKEELYIKNLINEIEDEEEEINEDILVKEEEIDKDIKLIE